MAGRQLMLSPEYFGALWRWVSDDDITDVDFNGTDLWITDTAGRRTRIEEHGVTAGFVNAFSQRVANQVSKPFNKRDNLLEAETDTLRISILHESAAVSGRTICLRKSLPKVRLTVGGILADGYMPRPLMNLLANCMIAKMNVVIGGEPGAGKTEAAKFITQFVPVDQRVITIEDSPEWHYHEINPGHDCVEMRVNPEFDYATAIKTCLRQNPKWIMLSEARSTEARYLIESWSTGVNGVTTIHTDDIRKIPSRLLNMMSSREDADRLVNDIYDFVHVTLLVRRRQMPDGTARRYVDQAGFLLRDGDARECRMIVRDGALIDDRLPPDISSRMVRAGIDRPFDSTVVDGLAHERYRYPGLSAERTAPSVERGLA